MRSKTTLQTLAASIVLMSAMPAGAQMSAGIGLGYGFGASKDYGGTNYDRTYTSLTDYTETQKATYGSLGQGLNVAAYFQDMICDQFGAGLELSFTTGKKFKVHDIMTNTFNGTSDNTQYTAKLNTFSIMPFVVLQAPETHGMQLYGRLGLQVNVLNNLKRTQEETEIDNGTTLTSYSSKTTGKLNLGVYAGGGVKFKINKSLQVFAEIFCIGRSYTENKETVTKYTVNGTDVLPQLTTSAKETEYVKTLTRTNNNSGANPGIPSQSLADRYSAGSAGLKVGVSMDFGGKKK